MPPERVEGQYAYGALRCDSLLLDVTQAVGRLPWSFSWSGAELALLSAHKFGGPKGIGALYVRRGRHLENLIHGAGHESGRRAGTEAVAHT